MVAAQVRSDDTVVGFAVARAKEVLNTRGCRDPSRRVLGCSSCESAPAECQSLALLTNSALKA